MTKKSFWAFLSLIICSLALSGCSLFENLFFTKSEVKEFSFSGYVWADGVPLADATVDCGLSTATTDEYGKYTFSGINKVVQVKVSKDGYLFSSDLVFVNGLSSDVNFSGYKIFDKSGVVKNNNVVVPNVEIIAESVNGEYSTRSNEYGEFYLPNLAGSVKVTASHNNYKFFTQSFTIAKEDEVVISGTTNISGQIIVDDNSASPNDFRLMLGETDIKINDDLTFAMNGVSPDSKIRLLSDIYYVDIDELEVSDQIDSLQFNCEKYYSIAGKVVSGDTTLLNSKVKLNNKTYNAKDGVFEIDDLHGELEITAICDNYVFGNQVINFNTNEISLNGETNIDLNFALDYGNDFSSITARVGDREFKANNYGKVALANVCLGDIVTIESSDYFPRINNISIENRDDLCVNLDKIYTANVIIKYSENILDDITIYLNGEELDMFANGDIELSGLHGDNYLTIEKSGYKFEDIYLITLTNNDITINPNKLYSVNGCVKSGDIILTNAKIILKDNEHIVDENGEFELTDLYGENTLTIVCDGYDKCEISVDLDNNEINADLTYSVSGFVTCAGRIIQDVEVTAGDYIVTTDAFGKFVINNLKGSNEVDLRKENFNFSKQNIQSKTNLNIEATYNVVGNVSDSDGVIENLKIFILNLNDFSQMTTMTDSNGNYSFMGLNSDYILFYDTSFSTALKPVSYTVYGGGRYNFADSGYGFSGKVICGNAKLSGVKVSAGDMVTYTDDNGEYSFDLLTKPSILTLSKPGYTFVGNGLAVDDSFDSRMDVDFSATYCVEGSVMSGASMLSNVKITIGQSSVFTDENGRFEITGLTNTNSICVELLNYKFVGVETVCGYSNLEFVGSFDLKLHIHSADIDIANVTARHLTNYISDENGMIEIKNVQLGDQITFEKSGYNIDNYIVLEDIEDTINIGASYDVSGIVMNAGNPIADVKVTCGETIVYTNANGQFLFNNLIGENTISFEKDGFNFDDKIVRGAKNLEVLSKYSVDGYVKVGNKSLSGVEVRAGEIVVTTNAIGYFVINDLQTAETLNFTKTGYEFTGNMDVNSPRTLNISATYFVSGIVKSGDILLSNVKVSVSNGQETTTDSNGYYIVYGIDSVISITFTKYDNNGNVEYNSYTKSNISTYTSDCNIDMTYDIIIQFAGVSDYSGITISINGIGSEYNSQSVILENLKGNTNISFIKTNYKFEPAQYNVEKATTINSNITIVYSISGYVRTNEGVAIAGAKLFVGDNEITTSDSNGKYTIKDLKGTNTIRVMLPTWNTVYEKIAGQVSGANSNFNITISNNDFTYNLLMYAYDNLRHAKSYQIFGSGTVVPEISDNQNVTIIYKKDQFGNKVFENKNYGPKVNKMGIEVDPNVSLLTYFNLNDRSVKYQLVEGENNVSKNSVNYTDSWSGTSNFTDYKNNFGIDGDNFYPYTIDKNTISSMSQIVLNSDGLYEFSINLKCNKSSATETSYYYYAKLMKTMCSAQDLVGFENIKLTYKITTSGLLRSMAIDEKYIVHKIIDVKTSASINYRFVIDSLDETIGLIDTTSPITVANCLAEEVAVSNKLLNNNYRYDIILPIKRREIL